MSSYNHQQICLFNSMFKLSTKNMKLHIAGPLWGESTNESHHKGPIKWKAFSCSTIIIIVSMCVIKHHAHTQWHNPAQHHKKTRMVWTDGRSFDLPHSVTGDMSSLSAYQHPYQLFTECKSSHILVQTINQVWFHIIVCKTINKHKLFCLVPGMHSMKELWKKMACTKPLHEPMLKSCTETLCHNLQDSFISNALWYPFLNQIWMWYYTFFNHNNIP